MMLDEIDNPFDTSFARSQLNLLFVELIVERRRISTLVDKARDKNSADPRIERAEACGRIVNDRLVVWLDRWRPTEPPQ
jgi:hypothetical protein